MARRSPERHTGPGRSRVDCHWGKERAGLACHIGMGGSERARRDVGWTVIEAWDGGACLWAVV